MFSVLGFSHHEYAPQGQTITKEYYRDVLRRLHDAVLGRSGDRRIESEDYFTMRNFIVLSE